MRTHTKRATIWVLVACVLVATITLTRTSWLPLPAAWLRVNDPLARADVIVVPSGYAMRRVREAAQLFHDGYARRILVSGGGEVDEAMVVLGHSMTDTDVILRLLDHLAVPRDAVDVATGATSTREDALAFRDYARANGVRSAIVVTSQLHSRRARWAYRRVLGDLPIAVSVIEVNELSFPVDRWWRDEDGVLTVFNEYVKLGYYVANY